MGESVCSESNGLECLHKESKEGPYVERANSECSGGTEEMPQLPENEDFDLGESIESLNIGTTSAAKQNTFHSPIKLSKAPTAPGSRRRRNQHKPLRAYSAWTNEDRICAYNALVGCLQAPEEPLKMEKRRRSHELEVLLEAFPNKQYSQVRDYYYRALKQIDKLIKLSGVDYDMTLPHRQRVALIFYHQLLLAPSAAAFLDRRLRRNRKATTEIMAARLSFSLQRYLDVYHAKRFPVGDAKVITQLLKEFEQLEASTPARNNDFPKPKKKKNINHKSKGQYNIKPGTGHDKQITGLSRKRHSAEMNPAEKDPSFLPPYSPVKKVRDTVELTHQLNIFNFMGDEDEMFFMEDNDVLPDQNLGDALSLFNAQDEIDSILQKEIREGF